jgi:hypothetical protein
VGGIIHAQGRLLRYRRHDDTCNRRIDRGHM